VKLNEACAELAPVCVANQTVGLGLLQQFLDFSPTD